MQHMDQNGKEADVAPPEPVRGRGDLDALTGLRFVAAASVVVFHFYKLEIWAPGSPPALVNLVNSGQVAVCLFFMLSGFILQNAYPAMRDDWHERRRFWIARFARIYPVYLIGFVWFTPFALQHWFLTESHRMASVKAALAGASGLLLMQNWFVLRLGLVWNTPGWTLSMEALFYLAFPWLTPLLRTLSARQLPALIAACMGLSTLLALGDVRYLSGKIDASLFLSRHPVVNFPVFICGMALGRLYQMRGDRARAYADVLTAGGLVWILLTATRLWPMFRWSPGGSGFLPGMAAVLFGLATGGLPGRLLTAPAVLLLGEASYALYILQFPVVYTLQWITAKPGTDLVGTMGERARGSLGTHLLLFPVLVVVSIAVFTFVETPCRLWLRRTLTKRLGEQPLPPPVIPVMLTEVNSGS